MVVTHADLNRLGTGTQTQGVVLVHQFRMIDPSQRGLTLIEQAPDDLVEEVRARVAGMNFLASNAINLVAACACCVRATGLKHP